MWGHFVWGVDSGGGVVEGVCGHFVGGVCKGNFFSVYLVGGCEDICGSPGSFSVLVKKPQPGIISDCLSSYPPPPAHLLFFYFLRLERSAQTVLKGSKVSGKY